MSELIRVAAGVLFDRRGRVLVAQRLPGTHMAGRWEFPGGKIKPGETDEAALGRELDEELGVTVERARPLISLVHDYPDRSVELNIWHVERFIGEIQACEGHTLDWVRPEDLLGIDLLEADRPIVEALLQSSRRKPDGGQR